MTKNLARTIIRLLPLTAVAASGQIALAASVDAPAASVTVENGMAGQQAFRPAVLSQATEMASMVSHPAEDADDRSIDDRQIECMAKVIVHEAGNQPRLGQVAVAQVIRTRVKDGRFGSDVCSVVQQRGQFFDVDAYQPSRTGRRWTAALEIAKDTINGEGDEVAPGALFFQSAGGAMRGRVQVAQVADHTFYR